MINLLIGCLAGIGLGIMTGLTPGLHPNTIIPLLSLSLGFFDLTSFAVMIVSVGITANFFEFIKSVYLSVPDEGTAIAPTQELIKQGRGQEAVELMSKGALGAVLIAGVMILPLSELIRTAYPLVKNYVGIALGLICLHFILREKRRIGWAFASFLLSGILGLVVLKNELVREPLLSLFTGFFGASFLVQNIGKNLKLPKQLSKVVVETEKSSLIKSFFKGVMASSIITFVPAIGPSQASLMASELSKKKDKKEYLITIGGVNTCDVLFSLTALLVINKSRSGIIELIKQTQKLNTTTFLVLVIIAVITSIIAYKLTITCSKFIGKRISSINYSKYSLIALIFIIMIVLLINGPAGLIIFGLATMIGLFTNKKRVNRSHMLGSLVLPTISYYL